MSTHTHTYDLTYAEVDAIRSALLVLRAHECVGMTKLTVDQVVELERKFLWPCEDID